MTNQQGNKAVTAADIQIIAGDGGSFGAYAARPAGDVPVPGVIVLQEIFGVNGFVRGVVDELAAAGFLAVAPDLFWRLEPGVQLDPSIADDRDRAMDLMKRLDEPMAVTDITAVTAYLRGRPDCTGKVAAVGYCLGGKLAFLMAARTDIDAAVSYYGVAIQGALAEAPAVGGALLLHIAGTDHLCPPEAQQAIKEALLPLGVRIETYPAAGHGFARKGAAIFDERAASHADQVTMSFLRGHLAGASHG
ncbi:MAG: carboxymethylenebutenolidase [Bradyrhizobium sp.]|nr:carboxymethylenebutenolidase [Bradyrhizobium sp.]